MTLETLVLRPEGFAPSFVTHAGILTSKGSISPRGLTSLIFRLTTLPYR
ncbi:MAG: hypothetical protein MRERC_1c239 [Mycoplasmataceae bacterium RC_NB112A]|nr:MAG: hypothetical protein MRERC_1c239 [Mycoplasmataceae bacterium RC_NB112A]